MTQAALYEMLRNKYNIGDFFIVAYLSNVFGSEKLDLKGFNQKISDNPNLGVWVDYAFSTNRRGREFAQNVRPLFPHNARRYLDVGSAYGGFLIGFMELGLEVKGIEYSENMVNMSRANFHDYGLQNTTLKGDILDKALLMQLGKFDVITCIDVIEHVDNVTSAIQNMVDLLNPGGILMLQMPNKNSISNILSDPHFGLFGITLLGHAEAKAFYFSHFPRSNYYDVNEYLEQPRYLNLLSGMACEAWAQPPVVPTSLLRKACLAPRFIAHLLKFLFNRNVMLPLGIRLKTALMAWLHISNFVLQLPLALLLPKLRSALKVKYADDAWFIVGRKKDDKRDG